MARRPRRLYWSHLSSYESCAQQYLWQYGWGDIDVGGGPGRPKPRPQDKSYHHAVMGIVIQGVLEDFYNRGMWTVEEYRSNLKYHLVKLTKEKLTATLAKSYVDWSETTFEEMEDTCINGVLGYLPTMRAHKFLGVYARSEVKLEGEIASWLPVGGRADFVIRREDTGITLLDGKNSGTKMKYVDPDQLRWYALCFALSYHRLPDRVGFVWFRYPYDEETGETGVDWVNFTRRDLQGLVERAKKVRRGQEKERFDPTPVAKICRFCDYESVCAARTEQREINAAKRNRKKPSLPVVSDEGVGGILEFGFGGTLESSNE